MALQESGITNFHKFVILLNSTNSKNTRDSRNSSDSSDLSCLPFCAMILALWEGCILAA